MVLLKLFTTALVASLSLASTATAATAATPREAHAHRLLQQKRDALTAELLRWKQSPFAHEAQLLDVLPAPKPAHAKITISSNQSATDDELWRLALSKATIAELERAHPHATFSTRTPFALLTTSEFAQFVARSGIAAARPPATTTATTAASVPTANATAAHRRLADAFDWSDLGCVARVKNQGGCGSCAYFAAAAALESAQCIFEGGGLVELSEQYLVSCSNYGFGCGGAWPGRIIEWAHSAGNGVCTEAACPYTSGDSLQSGECAVLTCSPTRARAVATVEVARSDSALVDAIATQPVAVTVAGGSAAFQYYAGGVLDDCGADAAVDHAVLAVGYGHSPALGAFYRFKNSWGPHWGEQGFVKLRRNAPSPLGACSILAVAPAYPAYY